MEVAMSYDINQLKTVPPRPKVFDNDRGAVLAMLNGCSIRGWSYQNDEERRLKTRLAREYVEGWCDGNLYK